MSRINRRQSLAVMAGAAAAVVTRGGQAADAAGKTCTLGFGAYGLPGKTAEESLTMIAAAGFDSAELTVTADRDSAPEAMSKERRIAVRQQLNDLGLRLTSLMEHVSPLGEESQQTNALDRLQRAAELAHDLCPNRPPVIQTVLGGKTWDEVKPQLESRLPAWQALAEASKTVICIKPHRGNAMSRAEEAVALLKKLGDSPWLRLCYDYSHFAYRDMPLAETIAVSLPYTAHIAVKDAFEENGKVAFALPGAKGTIDYADLLRRFYAGGYRGDVCVEVSSLLWRQPDYNLQTALDMSYHNLAAAFTAAGVPRPAR